MSVATLDRTATLLKYFNDDLELHKARALHSVYTFQLSRDTLSRCLLLADIDVDSDESPSVEQTQALSRLLTLVVGVLGVHTKTGPRAYKFDVGKVATALEAAGWDVVATAQKKAQEKINEFAGEREALEEKYGQVWDTKELTRAFHVHGFAAPCVVVTRKADGVKGSLMFQHYPRYYFDFSADKPADATENA